jgi:hypothetical protein
MIEGICPKCGRRYYGWALLQPCNQACPKCEMGLLITEDSKNTIQGYSPFIAEEYKIKLHIGATPDPKIAKDNNVKE